MKNNQQKITDLSILVRAILCNFNIEHIEITAFKKK